MSGLGFNSFYDEIWGGVGPIERQVLVEGGVQVPQGFSAEEGYAPSAESLELQAWPYASQTGYQEYEDIPISQLLGMRGMRGMGQQVPGISPLTRNKVVMFSVLGVAAAVAIYLFVSRRK